MDQDSILLTFENVLPTRKVPLYSAMLDMHIIVLIFLLERTERQFKKLLNLTGFEIVKVWRSKLGVSGSVILFKTSLKP